MQPNDPQQHPIDYLDSISTVPKGIKKGPSDMVFFAGIIGALLIAAIVGIFIFMAGGDSKANLSTLSVRLENLQTITDDSQKKVISSRLRAANTSLALALTNANRDMADQLTASGVDSKTIDTTLIAREEAKTEELTKKLEDARLNGIFDRIYAREMNYELDTLIILIEQLESETNSTSQKEFLMTTRTNLQPYQETFAKFDDTTN